MSAIVCMPNHTLNIAIEGYYGVVAADVHETKFLG